MPPSCHKFLKKRRHETWDSCVLESNNKETKKTRLERAGPDTSTSGGLLFLLQVALGPEFSTEQEIRNHVKETKIHAPLPNRTSDQIVSNHLEASNERVLSIPNEAKSAPSVNIQNTAQDHSNTPNSPTSFLLKTQSSVVLTQPRGQQEQTSKRWTRKPTFVEKLMVVLSSPDTSDAIAWMPEGDSFVFINSKLFISDVLPRFFKEAKFESFTRKLNRWGFKKRIVKDHLVGVAYFHEKFLRDNPDLCKEMRGRQKDTAALVGVNVTKSVIPKIASSIEAPPDSVQSVGENEDICPSPEQVKPSQSDESLGKSTFVVEEEPETKQSQEANSVPYFGPHGFVGKHKAGSSSEPIAPLPELPNQTLNPSAKNISPNNSPVSVNHFNNAAGDFSGRLNGKMLEDSRSYCPNLCLGQGYSYPIDGDASNNLTSGGAISGSIAATQYPFLQVGPTVPSDALLSMYFRAKFQEISAIYSNQASLGNTQLLESESQSLPVQTQHTTTL